MKPSDQLLLDVVLRQDLATFIAKAFVSVDGGQEYQPNWHIRLIADRLEQCYRREIKRLIITLPPRYLKSICASVAFPAWALGRDPNLRFICASYSQELSNKLARDCRRLMLDSWYRRIFRNATLDPRKLAEDDFQTRAGGYRLATSVGGTLTGRGGNFIIIDDPIKMQDAFSESRRQAVNHWYDSTLYSRLDSKKNDVIILIMQRAHVDDLVAHVMEKEEWVHVRLPAIAEEDEIFRLSSGDEVGRLQGEPLHAAREPLRTLRHTRTTMSSLQFSAQYQQSPVPPEGALIKWDWLRVYDRLPSDNDRSDIIQSWDIAMTTNHTSNYSACTTWLKKGRAYYLLDVLRQRLELPELKAKIKKHAQAYNAKAILIEDANVGTGLIQWLRREEGGLRCIAIKPDGSKEERVARQLSIIEGGAVHIPRHAPWLDDFRKEILAFPNGKHDDQVDSLSQFLNWSEKKSGRVGALFPEDRGRSLYR